MLNDKNCTFVVRASRVGNGRSGRVRGADKASLYWRVDAERSNLSHHDECTAIAKLRTVGGFARVHGETIRRMRDNGSKPKVSTYFTQHSLYIVDANAFLN